MGVVGGSWLEARQNCASEERKPPSPPERPWLGGARPVPGLLQATPTGSYLVPPPTEGKEVSPLFHKGGQQTRHHSVPPPLPQAPLAWNQGPAL